MSRTGQVAAVASAAAVLGVGYWYGTLDDSTSTAVGSTGSAATATSTSAASTAASASTTSAASSGSAASTAASSATSSTTSASGTTGTYTGSTETDRYGDLTVTVTMTSGKITDISYTSTASDGHSLSIESQAIPTLKSEAIAANSADIATVSGATYTSTKYKASLQAALDKA